MIRVLFVARYRDPSMSRKLVLMAQTDAVKICHIYPQVWRDEFFEKKQVDELGIIDTIAVPMIGSPSDPHRAIYKTLDLGLRGFDPDIIHAEEEPDSLSALQIAWYRRWFAPKSKLVLSTWQNVDRPKRRSVLWVMSQTMRAANAVFCANEDGISILKKYGYKGEIWLLPPIGVDTETFKPLSDRKLTKQFVVAYIGRLVNEKGVDLLIDALSLLDPNVKLRILGEGPARLSLESQVQRKGLVERVHFLPPVQPTQVVQEMHRIDTLVLPSRSTCVWKEQFGRVLTEAMACRIPVVGSNSGAIPEVIGDGGLVFPEGDVHALANCLRQLESSIAMRQELAERGHARVMQFYSQKRIAQKTLEYYQKILE
jgi:glycosyltransferase involved in cell wall biosynthesis